MTLPNSANAITAAEIDGGEWEPTYYCETCGKDLRYPPVGGECEGCATAREEAEFGIIRGTEPADKECV